MRLAFVCLALGGCFSSSSPSRERAAVVEATQLVARGEYQVSSTVDLTIEQLVPADPVGTLREFRTSPGRTLLALAEGAGVPAVGTLRSVLPDALESKLVGWLDDEIGKREIDGVPVTGVADEVISYAQTALTRMRLVSTLALDATTAQHTLTAIELAPGGLRTKFDLGRLEGEIVSAVAPVSSTKGKVTLGAHGFAIQYGDYAWQAIEAKLVSVRAAVSARRSARPSIAPRSRRAWRQNAWPGSAWGTRRS